MATARTQDVVFNSYIGYDYSLSLDSKLGCNLSNTPILNTYPTTTTTSKGTYIFDDNGSSRILCAGGTNDNSMISLNICSSTTAPYSVLQANKNGVTVKEITAYDGSNTSKLTPTELIVNNKDYISLVDQHSTQISNLSAVDVVELAKLSDLDAVDQTLKGRLNVIESKQPIIISVPIYHVKSVYADSTGRADYIPASVSDITSYSGLYYKNQLNQKINWYIPNGNLTVGDIKALMFNFYNVSATTGLGCPFYAVYTAMDSVTPNSGSWYKSRKTFSINYTDTTTINTSYALLTNLKNISYDPVAYGHTKVNSSTIPGNDRGTFADSEKLLTIAISTSSNSAAGLFEFIAGKFTIYTDLSSQEFNFQQL